MKSARSCLLIAFIFVLLNILSTKTASAQCTFPIGVENTMFVNGTYVATTDPGDSYVGAGDSLIITSGANYWYYVDGGYIEFQSAGIAHVHARNGATVVLNQGAGYYFLYRESSVNVINLFTSNNEDSICNPLNFDFNYGGQGSVAGNFGLVTSSSCEGLSMTSVFSNYMPGSEIVTSFGDGSPDTTIVLGNNTGYVHLDHVYGASNFYSIKQVIYTNNVAIDSITVLYDHQYCSTMTVLIYNDINSNCTYDQGIDVTPYLPVSIEVDSVNVPIDTISCTSGFIYTAYGAPGDVYQFKILSLPGDMSPTCPLNGIVTDTFSQGLNDPIHMGIGCGISNTFDFSLSTFISATAAILQLGNIYVTNSYCYGPGSTLTLVHSPKYQYAGSATPQPISYSNNTLTWSMGGITVNDPAPTKITFALSAFGNPLLANDTVHNYIAITPTVGDLNPGDNSLLVIDTVDASLDPNAIYVQPAGCVAPGTQLEYKIAFENIGNLPAENIYVLDTLPPGLDPSSMQLKFATHSMYVEKIYSGSEVIFKFSFPNIMLPDSSDHEGCHGGLIYTINTKSTYPIGSSINHSASIYFDYNLPVLTNTASTVMCWPANVNEVANPNDNGITLYPNPAMDQLTIRTEAVFNSYTISNSLGQKMKQGEIEGKESRVDIRTLPPGIYYISLQADGGNEVRKFVKI